MSLIAFTPLAQVGRRACDLDEHHLPAGLQVGRDPREHRGEAAGLAQLDLASILDRLHHRGFVDELQFTADRDTHANPAHGDAQGLE